MKKSKRKPREKPKEHKDLNPLSPVKYLELGSSKDPCFGKLYSQNNSVCKRCGDCETCATVTSSRGFVAELENQNKKSDFLDIEEGQLTDKQDNEIKEYLEKKLSKDKDKLVSVSKIATKYAEKFNLLESDQTYMEQRVIKIAQSSKSLKINKKLTKISYGKND